MAEVRTGEFSVSYAGQEANAILLEPIFFDDDVLSSFRVIPNVVNKKKLQFAGQLEKILQRHVGCTRTPKGSFNLYDREIETNRIKFDLEWCWDEFADTVVEELLNKGLRLADLTGTVLQSIIIDRVQAAARKDIFRLFYFGDKDGGNADYDLIDGLWTVWVPQLVTDDLIPRHNTGSGVALVAGEGIARIRTVYDNAPNALKALTPAQKRIYVSDTVYLQYIEDIEEGGGGDFGLISMINGIQNATFRGVQVVPQHTWNTIYDDDLGQTLSHLVLYTTPQNLVVATDVLSDANAMDIWYDKKDEKVYAKGRFKLGGNYVHHSFLSVGY